jgi:hypothetical protein
MVFKRRKGNRIVAKNSIKTGAVVDKARIYRTWLKRLRLLHVKCEQQGNDCGYSIASSLHIPP